MSNPLITSHLHWVGAQVWEHLGYTFVSTAQVHTAYHMPAGVKLYTEQYDAVFSTAIKGPRPEQGK